MSLKTAILNFFRRLLTSETIDQRLATWLGKYPDSYFVRRSVPGPSLYRRGSQRRVQRFGVDFDLDISDYQEWSLYFYNKNDSSRGVLDYVNRGDFVCDIGGNIGQTAMWISNKVGADGLVISFEPFPSSIRKFERNLRLNVSITNVRLVQIGLGAELATVVMKQDSMNSGANRITRCSVHSDDDAEITVKTLDSYFAETNLSRRLDFIKIDVEGFEMSVLQGARTTIERWRPTLFVELDDRNLREQGSNSEELLNFLRSFGYSIIDLTSGKDLSMKGHAIFHTDIICKYRHKIVSSPLSLSPLS